MARRRVNKGLVVWLVVGGIVGAVGLSVGYWYKFIYTKNPLPHIQAADKFMAEGKYEQAVNEYATAIRKKDLDPKIWIKLGDAQNYLAMEDEENLKKAIRIWADAVTKNPKLIEGHQRLLETFSDVADLQQGADRVRTLEQANESAMKLVRIAPKDPKASVFIHTAPIEQWLAGQLTDPAKIDECIAALRALQAEQPENAEIPYAIGRALSRQADDAMRRGDAAEVTRLLDEATKVMSDAVAARPEDPHFLILQAKLMAGMGPRVEKLAVKDETIVQRKWVEVVKEASVLGEKARTLVKPEDPDYVEILGTAAVLYQRSENPAKAEEVLRELLKNHPEDSAARLQLADLLRNDSKRIEEAATLYEEASNITTVKPGVAGRVQKMTQMRALFSLADVKLDMSKLYEMRKEPEKASGAMKDAETLFAKATSKAPDSAMALRLRGKMELFKGDVVTAIETLRRSLTLSGDVNDPTRYEAMYLLARAKLMASQTGDAEDMFRELADRLQHGPSKIELANLLLRRGDVDTANPYIESLQATMPQDPQVVALVLAREELIAKKITPELFEKTWPGLPEKTVADRFRKARLAAAAQRYDKALPMYEALYKELPEERGVVAGLAAIYEKLDQKQKAIDLLQSFLSKFPESPFLKLELARLMGRPENEMDSMREEQIEQIADPILRSTVRYEYHRRRNNADKAEAAFAEMMKLAPDDVRVIEIRFTRALTKNDLVEAEKLLEPISRNDIDKAKGRLARVRLLLTRAYVSKDPQERQAIYQQALDAATELTRERGEYAQSWVLKGQTLQAVNRLDDAISAYSQAVERQSENMEALEGLIRCSYLLKRPGETKQFIDRALKIYPKSQLFAEYAISWDVTYGNGEDAIRRREEHLKDHSDSPLGYGNLGSAYMAAAMATDDKKKSDLYRQKAFETFSAGTSKFPLEINLVGAMAEVATSLNKIPEAEKTWQTLVNDAKFKDAPDAWIRFANFYRRAGKLDDGIRVLGEFVARINDPTARGALAELYIAKGQPNEAVRQMEMAGDSPAAMKRRSELLLSTGKVEEARKVIEEGLAKNPESNELRTRLAFLYMANQEEPKARAELERVLASDGRNGEALFFTAMLDSQAGQWEKAMELLARVRDIMPENTDALKLSAELYRRRNDNTRAGEMMEQILEKTPEDKVVRIQLIELYLAMSPPRVLDADRLWRQGREQPGLANDPDMIHAGARILMVKGDDTQAMEMLRVSLQANPGNLPMQDTYFRLLIRAKRFDTVVQASTILMQKVKEPWIYSLRGTAYSQLKQTDKAMSDFETGFKIAVERNDESSALGMVRALAVEMGVPAAIKFLEPNVGDRDNFRVLLAQFNVEVGQPAAAIAIMEELFARRDKMQPNQRLATLKFLGSLYLTLEPPNVPKAREVYDEYLKSVPDDYAVLNNLAYLMSLPDAGAKPIEALEYAQRAFDSMNRLNQVDANVLDTYGMALVRAGQVNSGLSRLREAITRAPSTDAYLHLAEGLIANNEMVDAVDALNKATESIDALEKDGKTPPEAIQKFRERAAALRAKAG